MLFICLLSGLLAVSVDAAPQHINFAALNPVKQAAPSIPIEVLAQTVTYDPTAARNAAIAAVMSAPNKVVLGSKLAVTENFEPAVLVGRTTPDCGALPVALYQGPSPTEDTPTAFLAFAPFASAASSAPVPSGYTKRFTNLQASNNALGYMGFTELTTYDTAACAAKCSAITGCLAINIYFERDPTLNPASGCTNPPSETVVKCVFWGGQVTTDNCVNTGQTRSSFQVVIAGSNGYNIPTISAPTGYSAPTSLTTSAINAPLDCNGADTFLGSRFFTGSPFDPSVCAAVCGATSTYDIAHPPQNGLPKTCQFFNTYILYLNGVAQGQACSMYTESWGASYATNTGYTSGSDVYTIGSSYSYSNARNPAYASSCVPSAATTTKSPPVVATAAPAVVNGYTFQNCYSDQPKRGLTGPSHASASLTLEFCSNYCKGFTYFAVENGNECYCSVSIEAPSSPLSNTACSTPCVGNNAETCGGFWTMNVYKNPNPGPLPLVNGIYGYQGCYTDGISNRGLQGPSTQGSQITWEFCATFCSGFPYFGVENSNSCTCGNVLEASSVSNPGGCHAYPCTGNSSESCGGFGNINIYASQTAFATTPKPVNNFHYEGCYTDSPWRTLTESQIHGDWLDMTVEKCTSHCSSGGYKYAGLENSSECYCDNTIASSAHMVADTAGKCNFNCGGNQAEKCGGFWYISIYGLIGSTPGPGNP